MKQTGLNEIEERIQKRLMREKTLLAVYDLTHSHLWRLIHDEDFPKPVKVGPRASAFIVDEVEAWLAERIARSRSTMAKPISEGLA